MHGPAGVYTWSPYPEVNLEEMDTEHRALGSIVHQMLDAMSDDDVERALAIAQELAGKVKEHFAHEEALMRQVGYPNEARHAGTHEGFLAEAAQQIALMRKRGLSADVLRWAGQLDEWFHRHVRTEDMWLALAVVRARATPTATSPK